MRLELIGYRKPSFNPHCSFCNLAIALLKVSCSSPGRNRASTWTCSTRTFATRPQFCLPHSSSSMADSDSQALESLSCLVQRWISLPKGLTSFTFLKVREVDTANLKIGKQSTHLQTRIRSFGELSIVIGPSKSSCVRPTSRREARSPMPTCQRLQPSPDWWQSNLTRGTIRETEP
ncbi:hypothetical protein IE81DRAFT_220316 [Ceraceosorus guamensis]|uniref:Uncharacterized protein n=1 Tax=Ceraceosorus guamensis TaxID=1522189 RepID=A0A316VSK5_9BASI|nr:hypothetical protein IE81DRAFT_220316 [Ceraceosorus guamensis]PWN40482.1 hypothetical protein IE81DRAFT_220316 [Ceraceosorus guamensis]